MTTPQTVHSTTLADAQRVKRVAADQLAAHGKLCRTCTTLVENRNRYCPEGWEIAKTLAVANGDIRRLTHAPDGAQAALF